MKLRSFNPQASSSKVTFQQTVEGSTSEGPESEPAFPYHPKLHPSPTIATSQKANLHARDHGFCLITQQVGPSIAIQACHILPRRTSKAKINAYKVMWKVQELNIDLIENLVSLRADWHASYDANCWAFVPSQNVLKRMEKYGAKGTYQTPYLGYQSFKDIEYNFVAFPSLDLNFIARDNDDNTDNDIFPYEPGFPNFPVLKHHSHPYLAIANALPKFKEHLQDLTDLQLEIYVILRHIVKFWEQRLNQPPPKLLSHKRRMGDPDEGPSDEEDGGGSRKGKGKEKKKRPQAKPSKKPTAQPPIAGKGKGRQLKHDVAKILCRPPQVSYLSPPDTALLSSKNDKDVDSYFEKQRRSITAWIAGVSAAGSPKPVRENVIAPNGEIVRAPFVGDWHKWHYPWTQPPKPSKYSSNDWAMRMHMCKLTGEPGGWDYTSEEDDSGDPCMSWSW